MGLVLCCLRVILTFREKKQFSAVRLENSCKQVPHHLDIYTKALMKAQNLKGADITNDFPSRDFLRKYLEHVSSVSYVSFLGKLCVCL